MYAKEPTGGWTKLRNGTLSQIEACSLPLLKLLRTCYRRTFRGCSRKIETIKGLIVGSYWLSLVTKYLLWD